MLKKDNKKRPQSLGLISQTSRSILYIQHQVGTLKPLILRAFEPSILQ